jgi:WD40 repeat protein
MSFPNISLLALITVLACGRATPAADPVPPMVVVMNGKKTAAVNCEYPRPAGGQLADPTIVTIVRLDKPREKPLLLKGHKKAVTALDWSEGGKQLVSGGLDGQVIVWDVAMGKAVITIDHGRAVGVVAFGKGGKSVVAAPYVPDPVAAAKAKPEDDARTPGGTAVVWDAATGKELKKLDAGQAPLTAAVRVPKTTLLATAGVNTLCVWDAEAGKLVHTFELKSPLKQLLATADGKRVLGLTAGARQVQVFDPKGKIELSPIKGAKHDLLAMGLSADGKHLLGVGELPDDVSRDLTVVRSVFFLLSVGLSEVFAGDTHLKNSPCYVWNVASGKVVVTSLWKDLNVKEFGFGEHGLER